MTAPNDKAQAQPPENGEGAFNPADFVFQQERKVGTKGWDAVLSDLQPVRAAGLSPEKEVLRYVLDGMAILRAISQHPKIPVSIRMDAAAKLAEYGLALSKKAPASEAPPKRGKPPAGSPPEPDEDDLAALVRDLSDQASPPGGGVGLWPDGVPDEPPPLGWGQDPQEGQGQGSDPDNPEPDPAPPRA